MDILLFIQSIVMGIVEGITEFLPISSTGYLLLSADIMGFWTKEKADAPFLCIEPFFGLPDIAGEIGELEHKGGVILLEEEQERTLGFTIELF